MQSLISFIGGAGLVYIISDVLSSLRDYRKLSQHQKDITVTEIRKFKKAIRTKNAIMFQSLANSSKLQVAQINIISYLSSWSVNIIFNRINKRMAIYSLGPILKLEYKFLHNSIDKWLSQSKRPLYKDIARKARRLFKVCGII